MRHGRLYLLILLLTCTVAIAEPPAKRHPTTPATDDRLITTAEINAHAATEYAQADAELNRIYRQLIAKLDPEGQAKLKSAQRAWLAYRDTQADFEADSARGGTLAAALSLSCKTTLTKDRTTTLAESLKAYTRD